MKKLYLSNTNRKIAGVCGGLGEYFNIDPTIIRVIWLISVLMFGTGGLAYLIIWAVVPRNPDPYC